MLKILIVKDDASSLRSLDALETQFQDRAKFRHASDLDIALDYLDRGDVSCILLDSSLTDVDGRDVYGELRAKHPQVPLGLLVGEDGNTRLLDIDGGMSFHVFHSAADVEIFNRALSTAQLFGAKLSLPSEPPRLGPDATTKPPRSPPLPVDIVESVTHPTTEPEQPVDDIPSRVRTLEAQVSETARDVRFLTWIVGFLILVGVSVLLLR